MSDLSKVPSVYRAYVLGPGGGITAAYELACDTDERAIQAAQAHVDGHPVELWDRGRRIAVLPPREPNDQPGCSRL